MDDFTYKGVYIECGRGWKSLYEPIIDYIEEYNKGVKNEDEKIVVWELKEKWGELRIYTNFMTKELSDMIEDAEDKSTSMCSGCGTTKNVGLSNMCGWVDTVCLDCAKKMAEQIPEEADTLVSWYSHEEEKEYVVLPDGSVEEITEEMLEECDDGEENGGSYPFMDDFII